MNRHDSATRVRNARDLICIINPALVRVNVQRFSADKAASKFGTLDSLSLGTNCRYRSGNFVSIIG